MDWKDRLAQMPQIASVGQTGTEPRQWFRIQAQADTSDEVDVYVYGVIGGWWGGVDAAEFVQQLRGIEAKQVNVHINSVGGNVFDGLAIFQALRNHPARIITYVDALAASAASVIAMAGDRRLVAPYASLMVHKAWALCIGDDDEMHKCGDELARISRNLAKVYSTRATTDTDVDAWLEIMTAETWYSADESVEVGLMHEVQEDAEKTADDEEIDAANRWGMEVFAFAGRALVPPAHLPRPAAAMTAAAPAAPVQAANDPEPEPEEGDIETSGAEPEQPTETEEDPVSDLSDIARGLGLDEDADSVAVLAAVDALKVKAETPAEPEPDPEKEAAVAAQAKENQELRAEVGLLTKSVESITAELSATKAEKAAAEKARILDEAQAAGKFATADRAQWETDYDEAPGAVARMLDRIAAGTAVPVSAAGHTGAGEDFASIDAEYEAMTARLDGPYAKKGA